MMTGALLIVFAYLLGSVPFALLVGKGIYGVDVREGGSGNIGTTNVFRVLGKKAGMLVFAGDMAKGAIPVLLALALTPDDEQATVAVLAAGAAIAGHTWPVFLRFRGGKGVATGGGTIIALMPLFFLIAFALFWLVLLATRFVSVSSLSAVVFLSIAVVATGQPLPYIIFTLLAGAVIFYAHRSNLARLARRRENRVTFPWNRPDSRDTEEA